MGSAAVSLGVCELTSNPDVYAGKRVEVRGSVTQGFENFTLTDDHCSERGNAVWLTYGDRKESVDYDQRYAAQQIPRTGFVRNGQSERLQVCLAKASYTHKMNDLAQSSIQAFPIRFLP
jgi:hypothetical protein